MLALTKEATLIPRRGEKKKIFEQWMFMYLRQGKLGIIWCEIKKKSLRVF